MMRTLCTLVLVIACTFSSLSQNQVVKPERLKGLYIAPAFGLEFLKIKDFEEEHNGYRILYTGRTSVRFGLDLTYKQTTRLVFNLGVFTASKNFDRLETSIERSTDYYKSEYRNRYYEIHGGATYNFMIGRFDMGAYTNLNFAFLNRSKETRETETGNSFTFNTMNTHARVLTIVEPGLNFNYNMTYRLSFNLRTGYRLYTHSLSSNSLYKNSGIMVQPGVYYMF